MQKIISFILAEVPKLKGGEVLIVPQSESAPHYFGKTVPKQVLINKEEHVVSGQKVTFEIKAYLPDILVVEGQIEVENIFPSSIISLQVNEQSGHALDKIEEDAAHRIFQFLERQYRFFRFSLGHDGDSLGD